MPLAMVIGSRITLDASGMELHGKLVYRHHLYLQSFSCLVSAFLRHNYTLANSVSSTHTNLDYHTCLTTAIWEITTPKLFVEQNFPCFHYTQNFIMVWNFILDTVSMACFSKGARKKWRYFSLPCQGGQYWKAVTPKKTSCNHQLLRNQF